ncbi:MAG: hypothetical protein ABIG61_01750 [Planctomycetota bacterium]
MVDDRILWYALQLHQRWKAEIEQAIDHVKNPKKKRSQNDQWFRKMFYISQARDRKKKRALG